MADIDFQPIQQVQSASSSSPNSGTTASPIDFQPIQQAASAQQASPNQSTSDTDYGSKALAGAGALVGGALKGAGQTIEAIPNLASYGIEKGLNLLNALGIVPDSVAKGFASGRAAVKGAVENAGQELSDLITKPSQEAQAANPNLSYYSNLAGQAIGAGGAAGKIIGKLGMAGDLSPVIGTAANQAAQGVLIGAGSDSSNPIAGAAIGGALGGVGGAIAGKFTRSAQIINDKVDDALRIGMNPYSEAGIKSIKSSLDNQGMDITTEEVQKQAKQVIQSKLDSAAPDVNITQSPMDMIANMAKTNYSSVKALQNDLYKPLNDSTATADTSNLQQQLAQTVNKKAIDALPDPLPPNPTLSDLMTYRRQVSAGINQAEQSLKMGTTTADFKSYQQLLDVKNAVTQDLNNTAETVGLKGQLEKADTFHANNVKPFEVYDTRSGKLVSDNDTNDAMTRISKLLKPRLPNLGAMADVAKTLGPQGKQVFGYAYLQQAVNRSMTVDGRIIPTKITGELNKLANSGLAPHILTPELSEAFNGMRNIAEGALKTTKGMSGGQQNMIMQFVNKLTHSSGGITLLRSLGSTTTSPAKLKNAIGQILLNATEQQGSRTAQQYQ